MIETSSEPGVQDTQAAPSTFQLIVRDEAQREELARRDVYSLAEGFIHGEFDIEGDLIAAIRELEAISPRGLKHTLLSLLAQFGPWRLEHLFQRRSRAARNIRFHYDRSNDFYRQFLDSQLVYSCAYFKDPSSSLDQAQAAKLDHICRKLDLRPRERFLDVGCGWGALVLHAAEKYGAVASGCTLSRRQLDYARAEVAVRGLADRVTIREIDYRDVEGKFDKIASVGMFEHVGRRRLGGYFEKVASLLETDGAFLNHGIVRPQKVKDTAESLFWRRHVFPGAELVHLSDVVLEAENAGFEVVDVENLRPHYALTCRSWLARLKQNAEQCLQFADPETHRLWLLFLSAAALWFEGGEIDVHQVLLMKRSSPRNRRLSREYVYR